MEKPIRNKTSGDRYADDNSRVKTNVNERRTERKKERKAEESKTER